MKIFFNKSFTHKIKSFNNKKYYYENTLAQQCIEFIEKDKFYLIALEDVLIYHENLKLPHYEFNRKSINIPLDYNNNFKNLYNSIQSYIGDKTSEYIIFHEIGQKDYLFEPVELNSKLNYLFNGASIANKINHFLADNFKESYADCYAAFNLYQKHDDINVFDEIYSYRESEKIKFKNSSPNRVNEYFNHDALLIFKKYLVKDESFEKIHECIQSSIVKSIFKTIVKEIKINDSFLKEVKEFGLEFNKQNPVGGFLKEFKSRSNNIILDDVDELIKNTLFQRNIDNAKPLNNIRKDGHNFVTNNIQNMREKHTTRKSLLNI